MTEVVLRFARVWWYTVSTGLPGLQSGALNREKEPQMRFGTLAAKRSMRRGRLLRLWIVTLNTLLLAGFALAEDPSIRAKVMGKWQQSDGNGETKSTWTLKDSGDSIHVSNSIDTQTVAEFDCNTVGKECPIKRAGHKAIVAIWFNGAKLVEMETVGSQVVKRRFTVTGDGDTMELETIPLVPSGSSETTHFKRAQTEVSKE